MHSLPAAALGAADAALVEGRIVSTGGQGVPGARIQTVDGAASAESGADGSFELRSQLPVDLLVQHPDFEAASVHVASAEAEVVVELAIELEESLTVRAEAVGSTYSPELVTGTTIDPRSGAAPVATMVDAAARIPGVSENGQGGIFRVLSIRGISRQRVLSLFDGVRMTSERRAGVSVSFVDPGLLGEVDVRRGPASTYLGAGALGGAIDVRPRLFVRFDAELGYETQGDARTARIGWGNPTFSFGVAHRGADDTETPDGERLFSRYDQTSLTGRARLSPGESGDLDVLTLVSRGEDIGKSSSDFPQRRTIYPDEEHDLLRVSYSRDSRMFARAFVHQQALFTLVERNFVQTVDNESLDYGLHFEHRLPFGQRAMDGRVGVDSFQRRYVDAFERTTALDGTVLSDVRSLEQGQLEENAVFAIVNGGNDRFQWEVGGRFTDHRQQNGGRLVVRETRSQDATTGFVGGALDVGAGAQIYASWGLGQRFPSLSERFYSGVTGRGNVVGNPDLRDETAENVEAGLRWVRGLASFNVAVYRNRIDDYIERLEVGDDLLSFRNVDQGVIEGVEFDGFVAFDDSVRTRLEWQAHHIDGSSDVGDPLADIPVDRIRLGLHHSRGRWTGRLSGEWRDGKSDPGPSERVIPEAFLVEAGVLWRVDDSWRLRLWASNLLDETYFASADDQGPLAAGRSFGLSLRWSPSS